MYESDYVNLDDNNNNNVHLNPLPVHIMLQTWTWSCAGPPAARIKFVKNKNCVLINPNVSVQPNYLTRNDQGRYSYNIKYGNKNRTIHIHQQSCLYLSKGIQFQPGDNASHWPCHSKECVVHVKAFHWTVNLSQERCHWNLTATGLDRFNLSLVCSHAYPGPDGKIYNCHPPHWGHTLKLEGTSMSNTLQSYMRVILPQLDSAMHVLSPIYEVPEPVLPTFCDMVCLVCGERDWEPHDKDSWSKHRRFCGKTSTEGGQETFPEPMEVYAARFFEYEAASPEDRLRLHDEWAKGFEVSKAEKPKKAKRLVEDMSENEYEEVKKKNREYQQNRRERIRQEEEEKKKEENRKWREKEEERKAKMTESEIENDDFVDGGDCCFKSDAIVTGEKAKKKTKIAKAKKCGDEVEEVRKGFVQELRELMNEKNKKK